MKRSVWIGGDHARPESPYDHARRALMGGRWSFDEAAQLVELVRQGTAHLPLPITDAEQRAERTIYGRANETYPEGQ